MGKTTKIFLLFQIIIFSLNGCTSSSPDGQSGRVASSNTYHSTGWKDNPQHGSDYSADPQNCKACHGEDLGGGTSGISCEGCHHGWSGSHADQDLTTCQACHGSVSTCADCHHSGWTGTHGEEYAVDPDNCKTCHGEDLNGEGDQDRECGYCHHEDAVGQWQHGDYHTIPDTDNCTDCHGGDFTGANSLVSCFSCHSGISAFECSDCHTGAATSYADSAHGNTSYGVDRLGTGTEGDCTHCHDLPSGSTNDLLLFAAMNQTSQTENFCFQCHQDTGDGPAQIGMPQQRSYSYRAGGWAADPLNDVKEAFSSASSHNLGNILTFITGKWGYTADSNPCAACHNPHAAQRDPHTDGDRGWPVTLPSKHGSSLAGDSLWGDDAGEKMSDYTSYYQAPYRNGGVGNGYEPDASATTNGSNLTDYATFCQDCHATDMSAAPYNLSNTPVDWTTAGGELGGDKHGKNVATNSMWTDVVNPYGAVWEAANGLVLACTDCHEPHGSPSDMLIRGEVNGVAVGNISIGTDRDLMPLCERCHQQGPWFMHHSASGNPDAPYDTGLGPCSDCHTGGFGAGPSSICSNCHFHGGNDDWLLTSPDIVDGNIYHTGKRTF